MFKEAIKKATSKVFNKDNAKRLAKKAGGSIIDSMIADLTQRSPMLGSGAAKLRNQIESAIEINQINAAQMSSFSETPISENFKESVRVENPGLDAKKIQSEMMKIVNKIQKIVDKDGIQAAKNTDLYKKYEQGYNEYREYVSEKIRETNNSKESTDTSSKESVTNNNTKSSFTSEKTAPVILESIESNTKETVEILREKTPNTGTETTPKTISGALSSTGASFIEKVFNDKVLNKFAEKIIGKDNVEAKTRNNSVTESTDISNESKTTTISETIVEESSKTTSELKEIKNFLSEILQDATKDNLTEDETTFEARRSKTSVADIAEETAKKKNPDVTPAEPEESNIRRRAPQKSKYNKRQPPSPGKSISDAAKLNVIPKVSTGGTVAPAGGRLAEAASIGSKSGLLGRIAGAALPVAGVLAAGAAGYGVGTMAASGIDSVLSSVTGSETTLGGLLYDKFNSPEETDKSSIAPVAKSNVMPSAVAAAQRSRVASVAPAMEEKESAAAKSTAASSQPIIIAPGPTINNSSSGGGGGSIIMPTVVRNKESTFERVQMQDYWPRAI